MAEIAASCIYRPFSGQIILMSIEAKAWIYSRIKYYRNQRYLNSITGLRSLVRTACQADNLIDVAISAQRTIFRLPNGRKKLRSHSCKIHDSSQSVLINSEVTVSHFSFFLPVCVSRVLTDAVSTHHIPSTQSDIPIESRILNSTVDCVIFSRRPVQDIRRTPYRQT